MKYVIGVDEAGRGALAGPVSVGAVLYPGDFDWREAFALVTKRGIPKLRDSKKLSEEQRETLYEYIISNTHLKYASALVDAATIDSIGIVPATNRAAALSIEGIGADPAQVRILLDAGLRAPVVWSQESFVRGDENVPAIALASIIAKVTRDRHMEALAPDYPAYGFDQHKGYGTLTHRAAIQEAGLSDLHRRSFCTRLQNVAK